MDYLKINKYFSGEASEKEIREIFDWMQSSAENKKELISYKKIWAMTLSSNENLDESWSRLFVRNTKIQRNTSLIRNALKYAAVAIIIFSLGIITHYLLAPQNLTYLTDTLVEVPAGQMSKVILPDGTTVQLNSASTLIYSSKFNSRERIVRLDGEAFFDVAKDKAHPFLVQTKRLDFKVYGTSFNIQAYNEDEKTYATLVEGSLGVLGKDGKEYSRLVPGDHVSYYSNTNKLDLSKTDVDLYTSWKDGIITFRNKSLAEIAREIERWYNVEIVIENEKLANENYMGTIMKSKPIDQILEVFRLTSSLKYRIVQRPDKPNLIYWE